MAGPVRLSNNNGNRRDNAPTFPLLFLQRPPFAFPRAQNMKALGEGCGAAIDDPSALVVNVLLGGLPIAVELSGKDGVWVERQRGT